MIQVGSYRRAFTGVFISFLVFAPPALGKTLCQDSKNSKELYLCTLKNHPYQQLKEQTGIATDALMRQARQFENPTLDVKSVTGKVAGETQGSTELSLSVPVSSYVLGRSSKIDQAQAEGKLLQNEFDEDLFKIQSEIIRDFYRLRQTQEELEMVEEAISTFSSVEKQLRGRLARGPEQEITLNLVTLVQGDYLLKRNRLATEKSEIMSRFKVIWGDSFNLNTKTLPAFRQSWPEAKDELKIDTHFELRKSAAEMEKATADKRVAVADSWPKIAVGPTIERSTSGGSVAYSYGVNVGIDVPIFSINGGGRQVAEARRLRSDVLHQLTLRKVRAENEITVSKYKAAVDALKRSSTRDSLAKNHHRIDSLYRQGLASGTVIVEAHRQIMEFTLSQHEHEMTALDALINIYQLQGKDISEVMQ